MKKKLGAAALGVVAITAAVLSSGKPHPHPMKYRAEEFGRVVVEVDAGVLVRRESPCFREARKDPACRELLRRYPDGGR